MSPPRVLAALLLFVAPLQARAAEELQVIVTYELQHHREVLREIGRDPKAFWTHAVLTKIEAQRTDPPRRLDRDVSVRVVFAIARDGHLLRDAVEQSSGVPEVDRTAIQMVERAQPFPPMPANLADPDMTFVLPVRFR